MNFEIVIGSLMSEEKIFVSEFRSCESSVHDEVANVGFFTTKLLGFVPGKNFIKVGISWNSTILEGELRNTRKEVFGNWKSVPWV
jgi:hypothetical protein